MNEDFLSRNERARLEELVRSDAYAQQVLAAVARILVSRRFERVQQRAKDFLAYIVSKALLGQSDQIKETTIAIAVFGEPADFNPAETSKVRVAAADLRHRVAAYAQHEGQDDVIRILIPLNTYVPDIRDQRIAIAIAEFENWHPNGEQKHLCEAITAEVAYRLDKAGLCAVLSETHPAGACPRFYTLRGCVEFLEDVLRITVSMAHTQTSRIVCSQRFEGSRDEIMKLAADATDVLLEALSVVDAVAVRSRPRN